MSEAVYDAVSPSGFVLRLFGGMEVSIDGKPVTLSAKKAKWLLAILALRTGWVEREWLAAVFWPDSDEAASRYNLRRVLSDLKADLGTEKNRLQTGSARTLRLDLEGGFCDVALFDSAVVHSETTVLETATSLYRGTLLEDCMEEWVHSERLQREQQYLKVSGLLAERYLETGRFADAVRTTQRAQQIDPFSDSLQQKRMKALMECGDYAALSVSYRDFRVRLNAEMGLEPSPDTQKAFLQLRREAESKNVRRILSSVATVEKGDIQSTDPQITGYLPRPLSSLIGRKETITEICICLRKSPLITLLGPGGVGKTRIALEVGREMLADFPAGVWFADLSAIRSEEATLSFLMQLFCLKGSPSQSQLETLQEFLRPKQLLLILDNCEHLLPHLGLTARRLLETCPTLTILATSRQPLDSDGEQLWRVSCLDIPSLEALNALQMGSLTEAENKNWTTTLLEYQAVRLFVERVRQFQPRIVWHPDTLIDAVRICVSLDGLPLALELAAARAKALSLAQIASRLQHPFRLLGNGSQTAPVRQQTLRALLDWSYDLLEPKERLLLHRLAVFYGGWTLEAAEAICADSSELPTSRVAGGHHNCDGIEAWEVLDLLHSLVDKSLVIYDEQKETPRYRLLETVREYAHALIVTEEEMDTLQRKHRDHFLEWVWMTWGWPVSEGIHAIDRDYQNLIAALEFSLADAGSGLETMRLAGGLQRYWEVQCHFSEAKRYYGLALVHPGADRRSKAMVHTLLSCANMARLTSAYTEAKELYQEANLLAQELTLLDLETDALRGLSGLALLQGETGTARVLCEQAIALCRLHNMRINMVYLLLMQANILRAQTEYRLAHECCEESMRVGQELGEERAEYEGLHNIGMIYFSQHNYVQAQACFVKALSLYQEIGSRGGEAAVRHSLGDVALHLGERAKALHYYRQALQLNAEIGYQIGISNCLEAMVGLAVDDGESKNAAMLLGWVDKATTKLGLADRGQQSKTRMEELRLRLGKEIFRALYSRGEHLTLQEAIQIGVHIACQ